MPTYDLFFTAIMLVLIPAICYLLITMKDEYESEVKRDDR